MWRTRRIRTWYGQFLGTGDLAFDLGAHVGNRIRTFRRLGARVVAVEPQPDLVAVLRLLHGGDPRVVIEPVGVAAAPGRELLRLSRRTPTVSSFSDSWIADVAADEQFAGVRYDDTVSVPVTTLDILIERYGEPAFCKIDVEGSELDVLQGLSRALPALSFEYIPVVVDRAVACVERLGELGPYRFRHSRVETHRWAGDAWLSPASMISLLHRIGDGEQRSGDVYARRMTHQRNRATPPRTTPEQTPEPTPEPTPETSGGKLGRRNAAKLDAGRFDTPS